eukprot:gene4076-5822_t
MEISSLSTEYPVGTEVMVNWSETGASFPGIIKSYSPDIASSSKKNCDQDNNMSTDTGFVVQYKENVDGKHYIESGVSMSRINKIDGHSDADENKNITTNLNNRNYNAASSGDQVSNSVMNIEKKNGDTPTDRYRGKRKLSYDLLHGDSGVEFTEDNILTPVDVLELYDSLNFDKLLVIELAENRIANLSKLLIHFVTQSDYSNDNSVLYDRDSLLKCRSIIVAGALLLRLFIFASDNLNHIDHQNISKSENGNNYNELAANFSEELFETCIVHATQISNAILIPLTTIASKSGNLKRTDSLKLNSSSTNQTSSKPKDFQIEMAGAVVSSLISFMTAVELFLKSKAISDRFSTLTAELVMKILHIDLSPNNVNSMDKIAYWIDNSNNFIVSRLQSMTLPIVRAICASNKSLRYQLIIEILPLLSRNYSLKVFAKSYSLRYDSNSTQWKVSIAFIAILCILQSSISIRQGLEEYREKVNNDVIGTSQKSTSLSSKKKIGKSKKLALAPLNDIVTDQRPSPSHSVNNVEFISKVACCDCLKLATLFVAQLLQRCQNKDMYAEYRQVIQGFITELLIAAQFPQWPVCTLLLEQICAKIVNSMCCAESSLVSSSEAAIGKRDISSFILFSLDTLSLVAVGIRTTILSVDKCTMNQPIEAKPLLTLAVKSAIKLKITSLKSGWLKAIQQIKPKLNNKKSKISSANSNFPRLAALTLQILYQISSISIDAMTEYPHSTDVSSTTVPLSQLQPLSTPVYKESTSGYRFAIPSPFVVLQEVGEQEELLSELLPEVSLIDVHSFIVSNFLRDECVADIQTTMGSPSARKNSPTVNNDALAFNLSLWSKQSIAEGSKNVMLFTAFLSSLSIFDSNADSNTKSHLDFNDTFTAFDAQHTITYNNSSSSTSENQRSNLNGINSIEYAMISNKIITSNWYLKSLFENILQAIIMMASDPAPTIRSKVMKILASILSCDKSLILRDHFRSTVESRLNDRFISVREETVRLIGNIVVAADKYFNIGENLYLDYIFARLSDQGISVRKSVVGILREILLTQPSHPQYLKLCMSLLELAASPKEEESIKDMIQYTFQSIWFLPPLPSNVNSSNNFSRNISTSNDGDSKPILNKYPETTAEQSPIAQVDINPLLSSMSSDQCFTPTASNLNVNKNVDRTESKDSTSAKVDLSGTETSCENDINNSSRLNTIENNRRVYVSPASIMKASFLKYIESTSFQLIEIISSSPVVHKWVVLLLRDLLHSKGEGNEIQQQVKQRRVASFDHCDKIVANLIETLLRLEEKESTLLFYLKSKNKDPKTFHVEVIISLSMFCEAHPPFLVGRINSLLPYLKGDSNLSPAQNSVISLKIIEMVSSAAVLDTFNLSRTLIQELISDLVTLSLNSSSRNISSSIRCLSILTSRITNDAAPLFLLAEKCFIAARSVISNIASPSNNSSTPMTPGQSAKLQRCLVVLGYICENIKEFTPQLLQLTSTLENSSNSSLKSIVNFPDADEKIVDYSIHQIDALHPLVVCGMCYVMVVSCLKFPCERVKMNAVQALCSIFTGYPRLMLTSQSNGILARLFSNEFSGPVHERLILSLKEMMLSEEIRVEKQAVTKLMKEAGTEISDIGDHVLGPAERDSDATIGGFVLQQHFPTIISFIYSSSTSLRHGVLQLLATLLRQGMLCPLDVIGLLVTLQGDNNEDIRDEALKILQIEDVRHPTFLDNRLLDGVEATFNFQHRILGTSLFTIQALARVSSLTENNYNLALGATSGLDKSIFSNLYMSCLQSSKKRKSEFLCGLLRRSNQATSIIADYYRLKPASSSLTSNDDSSNHENSEIIMKTPSTSNLRTIRFNQLMDSIQRLSIVQFNCCILAYLPLDMIEDALHIVYWINRHVSIPLNTRIDNLRTRLLSAGGLLRGESNVSSMQPPSLPFKSKPNQPKVTSAQQTLPSANEVLFGEELFNAFYNHNNKDNKEVMIAELAMAAIELRCLESLIRLKSYIKAAYSLSEEKCQAYSPDNKAFVNPQSSSYSGNNSINNNSTGDAGLDRWSGSNGVLFSPFAAESYSTSSFSSDNNIDNNMNQTNSPYELITNELTKSRCREIILCAISDYNRVLFLEERGVDEFKIIASNNSRKRGKKKHADDGNDSGSVTSDSESLTKVKRRGKMNSINNNNKNDDNKNNDNNKAKRKGRDGTKSTKMKSSRKKRTSFSRLDEDDDNNDEDNDEDDEYVD